MDGRKMGRGTDFFVINVFVKRHGNSSVRHENRCCRDFERDDFLSGLGDGPTGHVRVVRIDHFA
jgi:hypothetical protein